MSTASLFLFLYRQFTPVTQTDWPTCAAATREDKCPNKPITRQRLKTDDDLLQFKPSATRAGPSVSEAADVLREENGSRKQPDSDSVETGIPAQFARRERGTVLLRAFLKDAPDSVY